MAFQLLYWVMKCGSDGMPTDSNHLTAFLPTSSHSQVVSGIAYPSLSVRHCAYWAAASCPPSELSAVAHVPHSAVVSLLEAISGWPDAKQSWPTPMHIRMHRQTDP